MPLRRVTYARISAVIVAASLTERTEWVHALQIVSRTLSSATTKAPPWQRERNVVGGHSPFAAAATLGEREVARHHG